MYFIELSAEKWRYSGEEEIKWIKGEIRREEREERGVGKEREGQGEREERDIWTDRNSLLTLFPNRYPRLFHQETFHICASN